MLSHEDSVHARRKATDALNTVGLLHRKTEIFSALELAGLVIAEKEVFEERPTPRKFRTQLKYTAGFFFDGSDESIRTITNWTKERAEIRVGQDPLRGTPVLDVHTIGTHQNIQVVSGRWFLYSEDEGYFSLPDRVLYEKYEEIDDE